MAITRSIINSLGGEGKWLFWFCEGLARVAGKAKCAICADG